MKRLCLFRYCILASKAAAAAASEKKASEVILEAIQLENEKYRLGHTKACVYARVGAIKTAYLGAPKTFPLGITTKL